MSGGEWRLCTSHFDRAEVLRPIVVDKRPVSREDWTKLVEPEYNAKMVDKIKDNPAHRKTGDQLRTSFEGAAKSSLNKPPKQISKKKLAKQTGKRVSRTTCDS